MTEEFILTFDNVETGYSVEFVDDGKVAYAYLRNEKRDILTHVWLYNCHEISTEIEWTDLKKMPFSNPEGFASQEKFSPIRDKSFITISWIISDGHVQRVDLFIKNQLFAVLSPTVKPGWSKLAIKNGPLARTLDEFYKIRH